METLKYFKLCDVKSGLTSEIAAAIMRKLVMMPNLEKVKLVKIDLEDKPNELLSV